MLKFLSTAAALLLTTASVASSEPIRVSNIEVTAEFTDMDASALTFWPNIETDLGVAIAALVVDLHGTLPVDVTVRIEELGLDGAPKQSDTGEFNHMRGRVLAAPEGTAVPLADFPVELFATAVAPANASAGAIVIQPVDGEFYTALINAFAATVVEQLAMIDTVNPPPAIDDQTNSNNDDSGEAPVVEAPVEEMPVVETPVVEAPMVETPVEDAPVQEAPVVEDPVVEAPMVETPVEDAPVQEAPVVEDPAEGDADAEPEVQE